MHRKFRPTRLVLFEKLYQYVFWRIKENRDRFFKLFYDLWKPWIVNFSDNSHKTIKTILQALGYIIALILGAAGEATIM